MNGVTAFVAWAAVNAFGNDGPETIVPAAITGEVVRALLAAHPYEEVAYELYEIVDA